ncbi:hypothetical protein TNCV_4791981 [Trichonephila clavipes]|nr:hypothetical protein TNCV_4791981 [Trichonephila clavipes]
MIQDYTPSSRSLSFIRSPRFSRHRFPVLSSFRPSLLSLPDPYLYIVCLVRPVARKIKFNDLDGTKNDYLWDDSDDEEDRVTVMVKMKQKSMMRLKIYRYTNVMNLSCFMQH